LGFHKELSIVTRLVSFIKNLALSATNLYAGAFPDVLKGLAILFLETNNSSIKLLLVIDA